MPSSAPTATSADVARLVLERVGDPGGDFTPSTHPTKDQVDELIAAVCEEVIARVGRTVDNTLSVFASLVVATGVAAQVELAFTSDVPRDTQSKYEQLQKLYMERLGILDDAQQAITAGEEPGDMPGMPWATFPDTNVRGFPITRWATRW